MLGSRRALGVIGLLAAAGIFAIACGGGDGNSDVTEAPDSGPDGPAIDASVADTSVADTSPAVDAADAAATDATDAADAADANPGMTLDGGSCDGGTLAVTSITPKFGVATDKTVLTVTGTGFIATPKIYLRSGATLTPLTNVAFVSSTSISGTVPSGLAAGTYDVLVVDPSECAGALAGSFKVVTDAPPVVLTVSPQSGTTQNDVTGVVITGCNFPATATVATVSSTLVEAAQVVTSAPAQLMADDPACGGAGHPSYTMTVTIHTPALATGAYLVRVKNPNGTFGDFSSFVVTNPSGKLTGGFVAESGLNVARRGLGVVAGRLDESRRFLYAVGGEAADGTVLKSVEVAQVDPFGQLGKWKVGKNTLGVARSGHAVVRQGAYLYAIGGTSTKGGTGGTAPAGTPLGSIERARILALDGAPTIMAPVPGAGSLPKGTYYYKVAAVLTNANPATAGETLPSDEAVADLAANGSVQIAWTAPASGTVDHYRVYRSTAADGVSGSEVLLKDNIPAGTLTYTDQGTDVPVPTDAPLAFGETGPWLDTGVALSSARLDTAAAIAPDPSGNLWVEVAGGWGKCPAAASNAIMDCTEKASISSDGTTLGSFLLGSPMTRPRMRHGLAVMTAANGPASFTASAGAATAFLVASGGTGLSSVSKTVEYALVTATGALGTWAVPNGGSATGGGFATQRDGTQLIIANGYAYAFFGGSATSDLSVLASVTATTLTFANWSNSGAGLMTALGRFGAATESGFFYVAGGTSNDSDALTSVWGVVQ